MKTPMSDEQQKTFWFIVIIFMGAVFTQGLYLYLFFQTGVWQLYDLSALNIIFTLIFGVSTWLSWRGNYKLATQLTIIALLVAIPIVILLVANMELVVGLGVFALIILLANQALPYQQIKKVFMVGLITVALGIGLNWLSLTDKLLIPELKTFYPIAIGVIVTIISFMVVQESKQRRQVEAQLLIKQQEMAKINAQLQQELETAHQIQQSFLPPSHPRWQQLDIVCYNQPAREVGGDFYAYYQFKDKHFAVAIGDVTGKGVAAALLMAICVTQFDIVAGQQLPPPNFLVELDQFLTRYAKETHQNCALSYLEIDGETLQVVNAGGIPPYILRANGTVEEIDIGGLPLGLGFATPDSYPIFSTVLNPQDMIILVSDGIVEANTKTDDLFGFDRLAQTIANGPVTSSQAMLDYLNSQLLAFTGNAEQHDDLTITVVKLT